MNALEERILECFPSGSYALSALLRLMDIVESDEVATAAVECRIQPRWIDEWRVVGWGNSIDCAETWPSLAGGGRTWRLFVRHDMGAFEWSSTYLGDINQDGLINISDIVILVAFLLDSYSFTPEQQILANINGDEDVNVIDIVLIVQLILGN